MGGLPQLGGHGSRLDKARRILYIKSRSRPTAVRLPNYKNCVNSREGDEKVSLIVPLLTNF